MPYAYQDINGIITLFEYDSSGATTEIPYDRDIYQTIVEDVKRATDPRQPVQYLTGVATSATEPEPAVPPSEDPPEQPSEVQEPEPEPEPEPEA